MSAIADARREMGIRSAPEETDIVGFVEAAVVPAPPPPDPARPHWSELKDAFLNTSNFHIMRQQPPSVFGVIRFDPINNCNLHCVYCHNPQTDEVIDTEEFREYLETRVTVAWNFQIGCVMEPTLDHRLADLMLMVAQSPARPKERFVLQTNGTLLNRHDLGKIRAAEPTHLLVSVDAADPQTHRELRNGTSLDRIVRNIRAFRDRVPEAELHFITTVTALNVGKMGALVAFGLDLGVTEFVFREMFYQSDNPFIDHERMPGLVLSHGQFAAMREALLAEFGTKTSLVFADHATLYASSEKMRADSYPD
jgi:sulfatase maturation enzyme AslB (radical SAM superfamily)